MLMRRSLGVRVVEAAEVVVEGLEEAVAGTLVADLVDVEAVVVVMVEAVVVVGEAVEVSTNLTWPLLVLVCFDTFNYRVNCIYGPVSFWSQKLYAR